MKLLNTIVTFTVIIPTMEVDPDLGIAEARNKIFCRAEQLVVDRLADAATINDCPSYPALCN